VTDISPTDAYAYGNNATLASGELARWNGSTWSQVTYPLPSNNGYDTTLNAISADSPSDVWIIGSYLVGTTTLRWETFSDHWNGSTLAMAWNGTSWAIVPSPNAGSTSVLTSVSTAPGGAIVQAVGYTGTSGSWNPLAMQNG
jgi:hypothetical protein